MKRFRSCLLSFLVLFNVGLAGRVEAALILDGVAAKVNAHTITISDVMTVLEPLRRRLFVEYEGSELSAKLREVYQDALEALIEQALILDAFEDSGATLPDWAVDKRVNEIIHDRFDDDRDSLIKVLSQDSLTFNEWRDDIRDSIIVASMKAVHVNEHVSVSPAAVKAEYERNIAEFTVPAQVKVRMIVIDLPEAGVVSNLQEKAERLVEELRAGADFSAVARESSDGSKAAEGGDWGWVDPVRTFRSELVNVIAGLAPGEVSDVVVTDSQLYVVKVEGRQAERVAEFEAVQDEIDRKLRREEARTIYEDWIRRLKRDAYIEVFEQELFE